MLLVALGVLLYAGYHAVSWAVSRSCAESPSSNSAKAEGDAYIQGLHRLDKCEELKKEFDTLYMQEMRVDGRLAERSYGENGIVLVDNGEWWQTNAEI